MKTTLATIFFAAFFLWIIYFHIQPFVVETTCRELLKCDAVERGDV